MLRILLLDCTESLKRRLESLGFNVELGSAGFCNGVRKLPSQVYEKDIFFYNPESVRTAEVIKSGKIVNITPQFDLTHLADRIHDGATFVAFINRLSDSIEVQKTLYDWIPCMPGVQFTSDKDVHSNALQDYPHNKVNYLASIVKKADLSLPVQLKLIPPNPKPGTDDVFWLFWNGRQDCLGVVIKRGHGELIFVPTFNSNAEVIETFLYRVVPKRYSLSGKRTLIEVFSAPAEEIAGGEIRKLELIETELKESQEQARINLATATREKTKVIQGDATAKQILIYYDQARREDDAALFYLYKIVETIENKFGGESQGIKAVGAGAEWKDVKRLANESYRDARHAPKPGDVINKWSEKEISDCFENAETVVFAYFSTLFQSASDKQK